MTWIKAISPLILWLLLASNAPASAHDEHPNILLVMIDDMGYGDLSAHGSPHIRTPHFDALHADAVRLVDFHVAPMCTPTRGQLLTGRDALRNGASVVASSRMMVRPDVPMLPAILADAGYATGCFGKWHLGENHPHRPQDRGFQDSLTFPLQEIHSLADRWENDYFDPWLRGGDGVRRQYSGYCTDVLVEQATAWMAAQHAAGRPFFCYLPLNVCHGPQWAPSELRGAIARQFPTLPPGQLGYLAMLANADENLGRIEAFLASHGLRENTLIMFLSDNGGYALIGRYNAGMRDGKSRLAEGGHRVPCFWRWPQGGLAGGRDVAGLTQVQDIAPTLLELCRVQPPLNAEFDGASLAAALRGDAPVPERTLIIQYGPPEPFRMTCVMRGAWRLLSDIKGREAGAPELYDLAADPLQQHNLIATRPEIAAELRAAYDAWWAITAPLAQRPADISLGSPAQPVVELSCAEWSGGAIGGLAAVLAGVKRKGFWDVNVVEQGEYLIELRRWPEDSGLPLRAPAPAWTPRDASTPDHQGYSEQGALPIAAGRLQVGDLVLTADAEPIDAAITFRTSLAPGRATLRASLLDAAGEHLCSAYYVTVRRTAANGAP